MEREYRLHTGGKINLFLNILGRRPDGYHDLRTLFLPLPEPMDELVLRPFHPSGHSPSNSNSGLTVRCAVPGIDPERNTLTKAYALYVEATGFAPALEAELIKGIPHGAGLGGGSADAALLLRWLQGHSPRPLPERELVPLAARVGADVPFFLHPRPCLGEGKGERLTPCAPDLRGVWAVLVCPAVRVSTAWAFNAWDNAAISRQADAVTLRLLTEIPETDKNHRSSFNWLLRVENSFEPVVFARHPELARLKARLLQEGASAAGLSGSGAALFGLFRERAGAEKAARRLREEFCAAHEAGHGVHGPFLLEGATP